VTGAWLSPAAARHIVGTANGRRIDLELVMLAGAPIAPRLARDIASITGADVRCPYGMTECLPVSDGADWSLEGAHGGHCVGQPVRGCRVVITDLDDLFVDVTPTGRWGEILVSAPWMFAGYDAQWLKDRASETWIEGVRFHRTGDVGYLDGGRLFHLGRLAHVIRTANGPVASVAVEGPIAERLGRDVCAVGVGPEGAEVVCVVVNGDGRLAVAPTALAQRVRAASDVKVAAVLVGRLPVDHRHQSKIDRGDVRTKVADVLAGR
jgi:acyl-CoA synthetase (AMP-forming)/AMP-acid ligase II